MSDDLPAIRREDEYRVAAELRVALLGLQRRTEEAAQQHGLTAQRYLLLLLIRAQTDAGQSVTVTRLCEPMRMTQSAVTQLVAGAVRAGLVSKIADPKDLRSQRLRLTAVGSKALRRTFAALGEERGHVVEALEALAALKR